MKTLCQILEEHNTDKNTYHSYGLTYQQLFEPIRNDVLNLLEIGVFEGESLRAWRDYFPNAQIFGLDINFDLYKDKGTDRITLRKGDQSKHGDLRKLYSASEPERYFDIIIDDGSHLLNDQLYSFTYFQKRQQNRPFIYVIEDVKRDKLSRLDFLFEIYLGNPNIDDDNLLIYENKI